MMTVHEVSALVGVSVRTLYHYDAIGLLPPTALTEAGYRLYDDTALARLQTILLIALARETLETGVIPMKFDAFDKSEQARLAAEVREKWGGTAAYQEYQQHEQEGTTGDPAELMQQFAAIGKMKTLDPAAPEIQESICGLQQFITRHFYTCTPEILAGLGEMYVADERFRRSIDKVGGEGTAEFVQSAIRVYCKK